MRRVAITGIGIASPLGCDFKLATARLRNGDHGVIAMPEWSAYGNFDTRIAAAVDIPPTHELPRKSARSMGRVAQLAMIATQTAITEAWLTLEEMNAGDVGLAYGSTAGSSSANEEWMRKLVTQGSFLGMSATTYLKFMSHSVPANLAIYFGIRGRVVSTIAACASASQAVGYGYEAIAGGLVDAMVCGGAEELHFTHAAVFDMLHAASKQTSIEAVPRPFDRSRDGLVIGEGAGTFVLEEYERAKRLGKHIYAGTVGYGRNCDGSHFTHPAVEGMRGAMELALKSARLSPADIDYVNAHATATLLGDVVESQATHSVFGDRVPVSSLKGALGHTLGACGTIEAAFVLAMLRDGWIAPTRNLEEVDPECAPLDYVRGAPREKKLRRIMSNKFAFGGINTSLIFAAV